MDKKRNTRRRRPPLPRDPSARRALALAVLAEDDPAVRRRRALETMDVDNISVVDQVWLAVQPDNRMATVGGFLLGGIVPLGTYLVAHVEVGPTFYNDPMSILVLGGLLFSLITVYSWGKKAFAGNIPKALGFVVLLEGIMVFSSITWLALTCLAYLMVINGVATGVQLALQRWSVVDSDE